MANGVRQGIGSEGTNLRRQEDSGEPQNTNMVCRAATLTLSVLAAGTVAASDASAAAIPSGAKALCLKRTVCESESGWLEFILAAETERLERGLQSDA